MDRMGSPLPPTTPRITCAGRPVAARPTTAADPMRRKSRRGMTSLDPAPSSGRTFFLVDITLLSLDSAAAEQTLRERAPSHPPRLTTGSIVRAVGYANCSTRKGRGRDGPHPFRDRNRALPLTARREDALQGDAEAQRQVRLHVVVGEAAAGEESICRLKFVAGVVPCGAYADPLLERGMTLLGSGVALSAMSEAARQGWVCAGISVWIRVTVSLPLCWPRK